MKLRLSIFKYIDYIAKFHLSVLSVTTYILGIITWKYALFTSLFIILFLFCIYIIFKQKLIRKWCLILLFLVTLYVLAASQTAFRNKTYSLIKESKTIIISGRVLDAHQLRNKKIRFPLELEPNKNSIIIKLKQNKTDINYGDIVSIKGKFAAIQAPTNPGQFDYPKYLESKQISGVFYADNVTITKKTKGNPFQRIAIYLRKKIHTLNQKSLPTPFDKLYTGLVFGDHGAKLPDEMQERYKKTGLTHLLVVSGSQVSLLSGILLTIIKKFTRNPRIIFTLVTLANIIFYCLTGGGASVFRAIIMNEIAVLISLMKRRADILHILSVTALIMLLINPLYLYDLGALLSFLATISLVYGVEPIAKKLPQNWPNFAKSALAMALSPFLWTSPLLIYSFNNISPISIVSNLVAVQAIEWLVIIGFFSAIIGFFIEPLSLLINKVSYLIMLLLEKIVIVLAEIPGGVLYIKKPSILIILGLYLCFILCLRSYKKKYLIYAAMIILSFLWVVPALIPNKTLTITFIDVGQGDATLIQTPGKKNILIDAGLVKKDFRTGEVKYNMGKRTVAPLLKYYGINKLDMVIITHFDSDHVGGIPYILENFRIGTLVDNGRSENYFPEYNDLRNKLKSRYIKAESGQIFNIDKDTQLHILYPIKNQAYDKKKNNNSIVAKLLYKNTSFLITGDLEHEREKELVHRYQDLLNVNVYKAGHHGSKTSSTSSFIDHVKPDITIISCGRRNRYRHPHPSVIKRLRYTNSTLFRTDKGGAITCESDGNSFQCLSFLKS